MLKARPGGAILAGRAQFTILAGISIAYPILCFGFLAGVSIAYFTSCVLGAGREQFGILDGVSCDYPALCRPQSDPRKI